MRCFDRRTKNPNRAWRHGYHSTLSDRTRMLFLADEKAVCVDDRVLTGLHEENRNCGFFDSGLRKIRFFRDRDRREAAKEARQDPCPCVSANHGCRNGHVASILAVSVPSNFSPDPIHFRRGRNNILPAALEI